MGDRWGWTAIHQMIHTGQGKDSSDIRVALRHMEGGVATLKFTGSFKDQAKHGGTDISHVTEVAGEVGGLAVQFRPDGGFQFLTRHCVQSPHKGQHGTGPVSFCLHQLHILSLSQSGLRGNPSFPWFCMDVLGS